LVSLHDRLSRHAGVRVTVQSASPPLVNRLTLVRARSDSALEMGTSFDTFSREAHTANATGITLENRLRLKHLMEAEGFVNYDQEWWHYSYSVPNALRFDRVIH
jgi:D-alanyl-D-alanine dipeptidase